MKYKLIALDLDGTLLHNGTDILEENVKAVVYAVKKGIDVVIATGRVTTSGRIFAKKLGLLSYIISCNGARVFDIKEEKVIFEDALNVKDAKSTASYFEGFGIYYHAYVDDVMYARYMRKQLQFYIDQNNDPDPKLRMDIRICSNYNEVFDSNKEKISKVMTINEDLELIAEMRAHISKNENIIIMSSNIDNIEIMNRTVSKGNALLHLAEQKGIKQEEIMAVGDNENDISMIEAAGMGIAMGNATDEVKMIADDITLRCEEAGVAKAIYKYV